MERRFTDYYLCIIVSLMMHTIIISILFITLTPYNHLDFFKKTIEKKAAKVIVQEKAVTLPAPVILSYGTTNNPSSLPHNNAANQLEPYKQSKKQETEKARQGQIGHLDQQSRHRHPHGDLNRMQDKHPQIQAE